MTIRRARMPMLLLLEILWGWALAAVAAQILSGDRGTGPSLFVAVAVVLVSAGVGATLRQFDLGEAQTRAFGVASMVVGVFAAIALDYRGELASLDQRAAIVGSAVALGAVWIRGATRNDPDDLFEPIARSAIIGVGPVAIAAASTPDVHGGGSFGAVAILYVPLALLVLALHQAAEPNKRVETLASGWGPFAVVVVGAGVAVASLVVAVTPAGSAVSGPISGALAPFGELLGRYVFGPIFAAIGWVFSLIPTRESSEFQPQPAPERPPPPEKEDDPSVWGEWLGWAARIFVPLAILAAILVVIAMLFQMTRRHREGEDDSGDIERQEDRDDGPPGLLANLRARFGSRREPSSSVAIRRLYADVLARAAADGLERAPSVTPLQFAPALDSRYAGTGTEITRAFMESRYGGREVSAERVRVLQARWESASTAHPQSI